MGNKYLLFGRGTLNGNTHFFYVQSEREIKDLPSPYIIENIFNPIWYPYKSKWDLMNKIELQDIVCTYFYDRKKHLWILGSDVHKYDHSGIRSNHNSTISDNLNKLHDFGDIQHYMLR